MKPSHYKLLTFAFVLMHFLDPSQFRHYILRTTEVVPDYHKKLRTILERFLSLVSDA